MGVVFPVYKLHRIRLMKQVVKREVTFIFGVAQVDGSSLIYDCTFVNAINLKF